MIISQTMTDMVRVTIDNEWEVIHGLLTGIVTFDLRQILKVKLKFMQIPTIG